MTCRSGARASGTWKLEEQQVSRLIWGPLEFEGPVCLPGGAIKLVIVYVNLEPRREDSTGNREYTDGK